MGIIGWTSSKLITRIISLGSSLLELVQPICSRYINVTGRGTDGRTTYDSNTALALRASHCKTVWNLDDATFSVGAALASKLR